MRFKINIKRSQFPKQAFLFLPKFLMDTKEWAWLEFVWKTSDNDYYASETLADNYEWDEEDYNYFG